MALIRDLSKAQLVLEIGEGGPDQFLVLRYRGTEGLSQLYRFEIEVVTTEENVDFDSIVGQPVTFSINTDFGQRYFHGMVGRFELTNETTDQTYYRVELVPTLWQLTHRYNSRIYQDKSVPEIIADVLTKGGIASDRVKTDGLARSYEPREYCTQYRETDYNFICRLMEEEGIRWYFEQTSEAATLILADGGAGTYSPIEGEAALPYVGPTGMVANQEHVFRYRVGQSVRPGAVVLNDFDYQNPKLKLLAEADSGRDAGLEFFDYPGEYTEQGRGSDLAALRAEEFEAARTVGAPRPR